jgi:hypothetical protein
VTRSSEVARDLLHAHCMEKPMKLVLREWTRRAVEMLRGAKHDMGA